MAYLVGELSEEAKHLQPARLGRRVVLAALTMSRGSLAEWSNALDLNEHIRVNTFMLSSPFEGAGSNPATVDFLYFFAVVLSFSGHSPLSHPA